MRQVFVKLLSGNFKSLYEVFCSYNNKNKDYISFSLVRCSKLNSTLCSFQGKKFSTSVLKHYIACNSYFR